jgi:DNA ligase 4
MPIKFYQVCELFKKLTHPDTKSGLKCDNTIVQTWFQKYDCDIVRRGSSGLALLSFLFPQRRADRVYGLQRKRLGCIVQRALSLGHTRMDELRRWQDTDGLDLASAFHRVVTATDETLKGCGQVTVEEIDHTLDLVASTCSFSSIKIQTEARHLYVNATDELTKIFRRQHVEVERYA